MSGYTKGPWRLFKTTDGRKLIGIGDAKGGGITDAGFGTWRDGKEQMANATLIAACPDLVEALRMEVKNCPMCRGDGVTDQTFEHIIGAAEGKVECPRCKPSRAALAKAGVTA